MNLDERLRTVCEETGSISIKPVCKGTHFGTNADVKDRLGNLSASSREHTQRRTHRNSEVKLWIQRYTEIGPVRDAQIICHHGRHGIEIQNSSTSGYDTNV